MNDKKYAKETSILKTDFLSCSVRDKIPEELTAVIQALEKLPLPSGNRVAIIGSVFGPGSECAGLVEDTAFSPTKLCLAKIARDTQVKITEAAPQMFFCRNPVDLSGRAGGKAYTAALKILLAAPEVDILLCQGPFDTGIAIYEEPSVKKALVQNIADILETAQKPVLFFSSMGQYFPGDRQDTIVAFSSISRVITAAQFLVDFKNTLEVKILEEQLSSAISFS